MAVCVICLKFVHDQMISINDTINDIQIKNILYDLNYKVKQNYIVDKC